MSSAGRRGRWSGRASGRGHLGSPCVGASGWMLWDARLLGVLAARLQRPLQPAPVDGGGRGRPTCGHANRTCRGTSTGTASRSPTRSFGDGDRRPSCSSPIDTIVRLPGVEGAGALPGPPPPGGDDRPARQRPLGPADRPGGATTTLEFVGDTIAVMDELGVDRAVLVGICVSAWQALVCARACTRTGSQGVVALAPWAGPHAAAARRADAAPGSTTRSPPYEGWCQVQPALLARGLAGLRASSSSASCCCEPHSTKRARGRAWATRTETTAEVMVAVAGRARSYPDTAEEAEAMLRGIRCPVLVVEGTEDRCQPRGRFDTVRPADRRRAAGARGRRATCRWAASRSWSTGRSGTFVDRVTGTAPRRPRRGPAGAAAPAAGALPLLADRARARPPRPRDRPRAAGGPARRAGRLADPVPRRRLPRAGRRDRAPGVRLPGQRVGAHGVRVRRARPARVPGGASDGRDPGQQLHGVRRAGRATSTSTCGSATRPGTSTTSCTRTPS